MRLFFPRLGAGTSTPHSSPGRLVGHSPLSSWQFVLGSRTLRVPQSAQCKGSSKPDGVIVINAIISSSIKCL